MSLDLQLPANRLRRNDAIIHEDGAIYRVVGVKKAYNLNNNNLSISVIANAVDGIVEIELEPDTMVDIWKLSASE